jgi:hypothetical protein
MTENRFDLTHVDHAMLQAWECRHPAQLRARAVAEPYRAILADWVGELAVPIHWGREVTGFAGRHRRRRRAVRRPVRPGAMSRRVRRRTQSDPQSCRHRVPRLGSDDELADR